MNLVEMIVEGETLVTTNLVDLDDGGMWKIAVNTCNENTWSRFTNKHTLSLYIYISHH